MKVSVISLLVLFVVGVHCIPIETMEEWSGENSRRTEVLPNPVSLVIIQHTVSPQCYTDDTCVRAARSIRSYHINHLGLTDIGYNFLIGGNGKVYEGAGWDLVGAHTKGYNTRSLGIAFIGDFRKKLPTPEALQAAQDLLNYGLDNGHLVEDYKLVGHRQLTKTVSPGDALQAVIEGWPNWTRTL